MFRHLWLDVKLAIVTQKCYKFPFSTSSASLFAFMSLRLVACCLDVHLFGTGLMSFILRQGLGEWGTPILLHGGTAAVQVMVIVFTADN